MTAMRQCKVGLLGCGNVGQGLVQLVERNRELIRERSGVDLSFTNILVRDLNKQRPGVDSRLLARCFSKAKGQGRCQAPAQCFRTSLKLRPTKGVCRGYRIDP